MVFVIHWHKSAMDTFGLCGRRQGGMFQEDLTTLEQVDLEGRIQNSFYDLCALVVRPQCCLAKGALLIVWPQYRGKILDYPDGHNGIVVAVLVAKLCLTLLWPPWTVAGQAPLSIGFPRQEYWSGLPFPSPGDLPDPGIEPMSPALAETPAKSGNAIIRVLKNRKESQKKSEKFKVWEGFSYIHCFWL